MSEGSTFVLRLLIPRELRLGGRKLEREAFFAWLWDEYAERGLLGVHEGTLLTEQATQQGLETESWTLDAAQAPRERDWIAAQGEAQVEAYFASLEQARAAQGRLRELGGSAAGIGVGDITEQKPQDWDAEWKKSFLNASEGLAIAPFWRILPAWVGAEGRTGERPLLINPGAGFGTGTHETTQLCLQALGHFALARRRGAEAAGPEEALSGLRVLDFGSGSGILAIGAALLGALVDAIEIDELAIENARENARLNGVEERIRYLKSLPGENEAPGACEPYPLVIANILRPVLVQFAPQLVRRIAPGGTLVLSGLVAADVPEIEVVFSALLAGARPQVYERGEWRAVVWAMGSAKTSR